MHDLLLRCPSTVDSTMVERTVVTAGEVMHRMHFHTDMEVHMFFIAVVVNAIPQEHFDRNSSNVPQMSTRTR